MGKNLNFEKKRLIFGILLISVFIFSSINSLSRINLDEIKDEKQIIEENEINNRDQLPKISGFSENYNGTGKKINLTLHQAYNNYSTIEIVDINDPNNNSFTQIAPNDNYFNSSFINITIEDIFAPNKSIEYETDSTSSFVDLGTTKYAACFTINHTCFLENFSIYARGLSGSSITAVLYNTSWDPINKWNKPDQPIQTLKSGISPPTSLAWMKVDGLNAFLNTSNTKNNTWAIYMLDLLSSTRWYYDYDSGAFSQDGSDDIDCWEIDTGSFRIFQDPPLTGDRADFTLKCNFTAYGKNPNPEYIGLKINDTQVNGYSWKNGSGYWTLNEPRRNNRGRMNFSISSEWEGVTCKIKKIQINYTRTDLKANATFRVINNSKKVYWNVTRSAGFNYFDNRFGNYSMNFTIPASWDTSSIHIWNNSKDRNDYISKFLLNNNYRVVRVSNASNGLFWFLNATSENILTSIDTYLLGGTTIMQKFGLSDTIEFVANFSTTVKATSLNYINLSIYDDSFQLNYTTDNKSAIGKKINLKRCVIKDNFSAETTARICVSWHNDTAVGYLNKTIKIVDENATVLLRDGKSIYATDNVTIYGGDNFTYSFRYLNKDYSNQQILGAEIEVLSDLDQKNITHHVIGDPDNNGVYQIEFDPTRANTSKSPFYFKFKIDESGEEPLTVNLTLNIKKSNMNLVILSYNKTLTRKTDTTQTVKFFLNNTKSNQGIEGISNNNITVKDKATGSAWKSGWSLNEINDGNYSLAISVNREDYNAGDYSCEVVIVRKNTNTTSATFTFTLLGNISQVAQISLSNIGDNLKFVNSYYQNFLGLNISVAFKIADGNFFVDPLSDNIEIVVTYLNKTPQTSSLSSSASTGTLENSIKWDSTSDKYVGKIDTASISNGTYELYIDITLYNYYIQTEAIPLKIIDKYEPIISGIGIPTQVVSGQTFTLKFNTSYYNGTGYTPIKEGTVQLLYYINGGATAAETITGTTDENGLVTFSVTLPLSAESAVFKIKIQESYNYKSKEEDITNIAVASFIIAFLPFIILAAIGIGGGLAGFATYKKVIVPKKQKKQRALTEVKTIFDDAINLEHILILYKNTGTCIFFKSYGMEEIDPELISGFISAVSSFGREMESQEALNEITYGDKMLLLADGEHVRVALVLGKKASPLLRDSLKEFIDAYEKSYSKQLPSWRGKLDVFKESGDIVDDVLNTSIILPHEISMDASSMKSLKSPHSKEVLKVAQSLVEGSDRKFFFIATLLKEASENLGKETAEVFMGIKELRDKGILKAIQIAAIEKEPISQQELNLLQQKVDEIQGIPEEEKEKLLADLAQMGPAEREAYLVSLMEQTEIPDVPVKKIKKKKSETEITKSSKEAIREIKNIKKSAKKQIKSKEFDGAIEKYKKARELAVQWELAEEVLEIEDLIRVATIEDMENKIKILEGDARKAEKEGDFSTAAQKFKTASEIASNIFKLGVTEKTRDVKRLASKARECEKKIE